MKAKKLKFVWVTHVTTTAGHVATSLLPTDKYTREFVNSAVGVVAGVYGFCPSYLDRKAFANQSIAISKT